MTVSVSAALSWRSVSVDLGGRRVLDSIDLEVRPGEFVGLLGPNGAGKTTLLRAGLGLVPLTAGEVVAAGRVGYVPQRHEFRWDYPIAVADAVLTGLVAELGYLRRPSVGQWRAVRNALDRVGLSDLAERPVSQLSGGQRQRVLVARALAAEGAVLLLDEPFTGLDLPTQEQLAELFSQLAAEGDAVVMTTHDLLGAVAECSRLVLLANRIVADGPPASVSEPEVWAETFGLSASSPFLRVIGGR